MNQILSHLKSASARFWREKEKDLLRASNKRQKVLVVELVLCSSRWAGYLAGTVLTAASNPFNPGDLLPF